MVIEWEAAEAFFAEIGTTRKRLVFNDRSGHVLPVDYGWESVADEIVTFIDENSKD
jgi:esterase/lipase